MILGMLCGALVGTAIVLIWSRSWPERPAGPPKQPPRIVRHVSDDLAVIGLVRVRPSALVFASIASALAFAVVCHAFTSTTIPSIAAGIAGAGFPRLLLGVLAKRRRNSLADTWPDVVDLLNSAVKAGLTLPEALSQLADRGPEPLQSAFRDFARDYQATGDFDHCLDRFKTRLSDPVADRIIEALRITRDVGGTDLGTLLRTLASFLRDDARVRSELKARQSWTINGARLALVAPWIVLVLMMMRPEAASAYDTPAGGLLIMTGGLVSLIAYRVMLAFAQLPSDERVLQ